MKTTMINETRSYKKLVQINDFFNAFGRLFPAGSVAANQFAIVARAVETLSEFAASQVTAIGADRGSKNQLTAARTDLRNHLHSISGTSRAAGAETPGLEDKFFLPGGRLSDQKLLAAGHAFLKDAEPLADAFIQHEMAADF